MKVYGVFPDNIAQRMDWRALRWTGDLSRVSPAFAQCQLGSAPESQAQYWSFPFSGLVA